VAKYIRDYKDLSPTFEENLIRFDGRRSIDAFVPVYPAIEEVNSFSSSYFT
jgi:hypothetical protein